MKEINDLLDLIRLEKIDENTFQGYSQTVGNTVVYGGQVLAQGLYAMGMTVPENRIAHSFHSYFILPGDLEKPITYQVEVIRDGGSFSTRRVKAMQDDNIIYFMAGSFHAEEKGYNHQIPMPEAPQPSELYSWDDMYQQLKDVIPKPLKQFLAIDRPIIFKPTQIDNVLLPEKKAPHNSVWFKIKGETQNDSLLNRCVLAYISDYNLLSTSLRPHADKAHMGNVKMASIDHGMWFHREANINDWFLYQVDSPSASDARGYTTGKIFDANGKLIASTTQEGLLRMK